MIQQIFEVANKSYVMLQCKQKSLILGIVADKKMNAELTKLSTLIEDGTL